MALNLTTYFTTASKVRGGKAVWVKDAGHEERANVLLGSTVKNPPIGFGHAFAAGLYEYKPFEEGLLFRSFAIGEKVSSASAKTLFVNGDGYSDVPEVGMTLMKAPDAINVVSYAVSSSTVTATTKEYTGQSAKVTAVEFDESKQMFKVTLDAALGTLETTDILVEAEGESASASAKVLVKNPNTFIEVDADFIPSNGAYGFDNVQHDVNVVYDKKAWIQRMQPLPKYVLALNKSHIDGIFEL